MHTPFGNIEREGELAILGHRIDGNGKSRTAVDYRIGQSWKHYWSHTQLSNKLISLNRRIQRWGSTVLRTLVRGDAAWRLTVKGARKLSHTCVEMIRKMTKGRRKPGEAWLEWYKRSCRVARARIWKAFGTDVIGIAARDVHKWGGHVARQAHSASATLLAHKNTIWWQTVEPIYNLLDSAGLTGWRRPRWGRPWRWENPLVKHYDAD